MFRFRSWCMFFLVLFLIVSLMACGQAQDLPPADPGQEQEEMGQEEAAGTGDEPDASDLMSLFQELEQVSYETVVSAPDLPQDMTMKTWVKGDKIRMEMEGEQGVYSGKVITIMDETENVLYIYNPQENSATKMDMSLSAEDEQLDPEEFMNDLDNYVYIGRDTIDGKRCQVYEAKEGDTTVKMWIWEQHGFPLRMEISDEYGTTVAEFRNISFGNIPDSMFEIPAGVEVVDLSQFMN